MSKSGGVDATRDYYDSEGAEGFYSTIWGGEDLHIGIYEDARDSIREASTRTVSEMARKLDVTRGDTIVDLGAGYGGSARYLARETSARVTCLNLSSVQNERNRRLTREQGLTGLISIVEGNFEELPFSDASFSAAWSQDAILHSTDRTKVLSEVARVLTRDGTFVCTDPMQADDADPRLLSPVLERLDLESLASPAFYESAGTSVGLPLRSFVDLSEHLTRHYSRVLEELELHEELVRQRSGDEYVDRMKRGLANWVTAGEAGALVWGIMVFSK